MVYEVIKLFNHLVVIFTIFYWPKLISLVITTHCWYPVTAVSSYHFVVATVNGTEAAVATRAENTIHGRKCLGG